MKDDWVDYDLGEVLHDMAAAARVTLPISGLNVHGSTSTASVHI